MPPSWQRGGWAHLLHTRYCSHCLSVWSRDRGTVASTWADAGGPRTSLTLVAYGPYIPVAPTVPSVLPPGGTTCLLSGHWLQAALGSLGLSHSFQEGIAPLRASRDPLNMACGTCGYRLQKASPALLGPLPRLPDFPFLHTGMGLWGQRVSPVSTGTYR